MITPFDFDDLTSKVSENLYKGTSKKLFNKTHKDLAKFGNNLVKKGQLKQDKILEIGAGRGEFYEYIENNFQSYLMTDISDWGKNHILELGKKDPRIKFEQQNIEDIKYEDNYFDRIIVSCVIAHVTEPFKALEEVRRVTKPGGVISIFISTDPSILLRTARKVFTERKMKNLPIPYKLLNSIQHRNTPTSILDMVDWSYQKDKVEKDYLPFKIKSWNLSTHLIVNIKKS
jgi:phosphatidylethanolamine/phosphatidyl-N-methylethanolamine N-methyltransferase